MKQSTLVILLIFVFCNTYAQWPYGTPEGLERIKYDDLSAEGRAQARSWGYTIPGEEADLEFLSETFFAEYDIIMDECIEVEKANYTFYRSIVNRGEILAMAEVIIKPEWTNKIRDYYHRIHNYGIRMEDGVLAAIDGNKLYIALGSDCPGYSDLRCSHHLAARFSVLKTGANHHFALTKETLPEGIIPCTREETIKAAVSISSYGGCYTVTKGGITVAYGNLQKALYFHPGFETISVSYYKTPDSEEPLFGIMTKTKLKDFDERVGVRRMSTLFFIGGADKMYSYNNLPLFLSGDNDKYVGIEITNANYATEILKRKYSDKNRFFWFDNSSNLNGKGLYIMEEIKKSIKGYFQQDQ